MTAVVPIGGPGSRLPFIVESFLAWSLALGCLAVSGYYYLSMRLSTFCRRRQRLDIVTRSVLVTTTLLLSSFFFVEASAEKDIDDGEDDDDSTTSSLPCWLPLTTYTKAEASRATPTERYWQLVAMLNNWSEGSDDTNNILGVGSASAVLSGRKTTSALEDSYNGDKAHCLSSGAFGERGHNGRKRQQNREKVTEERSSSSDAAELSDRELVRRLRNNLTLRRLATLAMRPTAAGDDDNEKVCEMGSCCSTSNKGSNCCRARRGKVSQLPLGRQLIRCWGDVLRIPREEDEGVSGGSSDTRKMYDFDISLIVPCYGESGDHVRRKVDHALANCMDPRRVELVLVNAGMCTDLDQAVMAERNERTWGRSKIIHLVFASAADVFVERVVADGHPTNGTILNRDSHFNHEQMNGNCSGRSHPVNRSREVTVAVAAEGRGPCLNVGAEHSSGRILSFCHSDTRLPRNWDFEIDRNLSSSCTATSGRRTANSCAFHFSIDTSPVGLLDGSGGGGPNDQVCYFPPGIRGVEWTANSRCRWWKLPYGDQCLSVPARVFKYLGGYPHQPIMEDYDLIKLLRQRAALLSHFPKQFDQIEEHEELVLVPGEPVKCSPRRWQKYGVLYVTYTNSKLVRQYESDALSPEDIYEEYYGQLIPCSTSPWENEVENEAISRKSVLRRVNDERD